MSAEDLGARELGQVRSSRLDELLTTLRLLHSPNASSKVGIPVLDDLLAANTPRFDPTNLSSIPAPPIIEITSPDPKDGKTELLYWIMANLVSGDPSCTDDPTIETQEPETAAGAPAIETDTDTNTEPHHQELNSTTTTTNPSTRPNQGAAIALLSTQPFSIPRLSQTLLHLVSLNNPNLPLSTLQAKTHSLLSHIHIFPIPSLSALLPTIASLQSYFLSPQNPSASKKLGAIMLDSASTFFWEDKVNATTSTCTTTTTAAASPTSKFSALASLLKSTSQSLQTPIFYTTQTFFSSSSPLQKRSSSSLTSTMSIKPQLPPPWSNLPSLRLVIYRKGMRRFGEGVDAEGAMTDKKDKKSAEDVFVVRLNGWAGDGDAFGGHDGGGEGRRGFELAITSRGVELL